MKDTSVFVSPVTAAIIAALKLGFCCSGAEAGQFVTLYNFTGGADGAEPNGGVIAASNGTIYGETFTGGGLSCTSKHGEINGCGTVFSFTSSGGLKVLATFTGANGAYGNNGLDLAGPTLYGTTEYGGASDDGVLFSVNIDGTGYTLLHQFVGTDGRHPTGSLVVATNGTIYGITQNGGTAANVGVLFSLTPKGVYTLLHSFNGSDGSQPDSLVMTSTGVLVGSTLYGGTKSSGCATGCGTVFTYAPVKKVFTTVFYLPSSGIDGIAPYVGSVGPGPTIYAAQNINVFGLSQNTGFTALADLNFYLIGNGTHSGPLYTPSGVLYGVVFDGPGGGYGAVYQVQKGAISDVYPFSGASDGGSPTARPFLMKSDTLIGTTSEYGDCFQCGTIWEYIP